MNWTTMEDKVFNTVRHEILPASSKIDNSIYDKGRDVISVPSWGIKDFMNTRARWQKGIDPYSVDPSFCYFKIFFNFDSLYGLFGGILNNSSEKTENKAENSAYQYLTNLINGGRTNVDEMKDRRDMLVRFTNTLHYISENAPWFFNEINGLRNGEVMDFENLTKEKTLEINCMHDAVDMRLTTLIDMYKFICFDSVNCKEVIPENLRKFDIQVVIFNAPIKYYQTGIRSQSNGTVQYKSFDDDDYANRMSFKMITFKNCEFDLNTMHSVPDSISNADPFQLQYQMAIKYTRAYEHNLNEWMQIFFGANKILWDENKYKDDGSEAKRSLHAQKSEMNSTTNRISAMKNAAKHIYYYNPFNTPYKSLVDASEEMMNNAINIANHL